MELREGFKNTEVGVIPEDWEVKELSELTTLMTNGFVGVATIHYTEFEDGVTYIQGYNVEENSFNFTGIKKVTRDFHKQHSKSCLQEGDLLTIQTGDVGLTTTVTKDLEGSNCHALIITRFKKNSLVPKFYSYYLNSGRGKSQLKEIETGSTMKHINVGDMIHVKVPVPTKTEQTAITTALSDADALINSLEKLIAKKRNIKQGAMQQLLKPKEGWEVKKLGEVCDIFKGKGISKSQISESGKYECILYGELFTTYKEVISTAVSKTNTSESIPSKRGDILYPGSTTTTGIDLAKASAILKDNVLLGGDIVILRRTSYDYNPIFLSYFLNEIRRNDIAQTTKGITIHHLYGKDLAGIYAAFPSIEEQNTIATILSDMDNEIQALETKLEKYRKVKLGMMQNLLTGKIRLV